MWSSTWDDEIYKCCSGIWLDEYDCSLLQFAREALFNYAKCVQVIKFIIAVIQMRRLVLEQWNIENILGCENILFKN